MKAKTPADPRLVKIAQDWTNVPTLETRNSDSLDFHDVGVGALRAALEAAYELGKRDAAEAIHRANFSSK